MSMPDRKSPKSTPEKTSSEPADARAAQLPVAPPPREIGGPAGPEPTRFGDWERNGRCIDF
jgi:hypothetical protein